MTDDSVSINRAWANRQEPPEYDECGICGKLCNCSVQKILGWQDSKPCDNFTALDSPILEDYCCLCYNAKSDHEYF